VKRIVGKRRRWLLVRDGDGTEKLTEGAANIFADFCVSQHIGIMAQN
jgi:hypothetical protein